MKAYSRRLNSPCAASLNRCPNGSDGTMPRWKPPSLVVAALAISLKSLTAMKRQFVVGDEISPTLQSCRRADPEKRGGSQPVDHRFSGFGRRLSRHHSRLHGRRSHAAACALDQPFATCPAEETHRTRLSSRPRGSNRLAAKAPFRPTPSAEKDVDQTSSAP